MIHPPSPRLPQCHILWGCHMVFWGSYWYFCLYETVSLLKCISSIHLPITYYPYPLFLKPLFLSVIQNCKPAPSPMHSSDIQSILSLKHTRSALPPVSYPVLAVFWPSSFVWHPCMQIINLCIIPLPFAHLFYCLFFSYIDPSTKHWVSEENSLSPRNRHSSFIILEWKGILLLCRYSEEILSSRAKWV